MSETATGTATVLFTDLVGSTELRSRLGEEAGERLRRTHDRLVIDAITAHAGTVVKGLGDGFLATFAGAADAVGAAVEVQRGLDRLNRRSVVQLAIRIGISAGDVTWADGDCFGLPVIEASRLCAAADGGTVLCAETVRWLARGHGSHEFRGRGEMQLKGLDEPTAVCEVAWTPHQREVALPPVLSGDDSVRLVGRVTEWEELGTAWKRAATGERAVVLLAGEPGVGKTRLAAELARSVAADGAHVLGGRCDEDLGVPYQPFAEALRHYVRGLDGAPPTLGQGSGDLVRLLPELATLVPTLPDPVRSESEVERYRLFDAVVSWLTALTAEAPVLLVLDDLHWAAKPTLLLLRHLVRADESDRLLVVGTYRDTDLSRTHPLAETLADFRRETIVTRMAVRGLDAAGVGAYLEAVAGHDLDDRALALAQAIHAETEGNPFFVGEVLRHLAETGAIYQQNGRWTSDLTIDQAGIPEGVREVIGRRLSRLSQTANTVLSRAAVVGLSFDARLLPSVCEMSEDDIDLALDEAVSARLVTPAPGSATRFQFAHGLVRATLYDELPSLRRIRLHQRVGEGIERLARGRLDEHVSDLAFHFGESAAGGDLHKAIDYTMRAGNRALAQHAEPDAVRLFGRALELLDEVDAPDPARRCDLLIGLGIAQRDTGDPSFRQTLLDAAAVADELGDADRLASAVLANTRGYWSNAGITDQDRLRFIDAALAAVGTQDSPVRARLLALRAVELMWVADSRDRYATAETALEVARRVDDPVVTARVYGPYLAARFGAWSTEERRRLLPEIATVAAEVQDPGLAFEGAWYGVMSALESCDRQWLDACMAECRRISTELGQPRRRWETAVQEAAVALACEWPAAAEQHATAALELGTAAGQPDAFLWYAVQITIVRWQQGRDGELAPLLAEQVANMPSVPAWETTLAVASLTVDPGRSREILDRYAATGFRLPQDLTWSVGVVGLAMVCAWLRVRDYAQELYGLLAPYAGQMVTQGIVTSGPMDFHLARLADVLDEGETADRHFADALGMCERFGAPGFRGYVQAGWAASLRRRGADTARVNELLVAARRVADELGWLSITSLLQNEGLGADSNGRDS
ncbi:MAG TPA: AAA family ATPase [Mycobacteriales bacterium]|nr:AAA family ATPase [Mycobacteriales bacterium]